MPSWIISLIIIVAVVALVVLGGYRIVRRVDRATVSPALPLGGRGPARGRVCDFCNASSVCCTFSAATVQAAARSDYRPNAPFGAVATNLGIDPSVFENSWLDQVMRDTTAWSACAACADQLEMSLR